MPYRLSIATAGKAYVNPNEVIPDSAFGAEFLGWEPFSNFTTRNAELNLPHIRWPGGIPVEEGINVDGSADGSREHVFDLKFDNLVEWDRNNGAPREGIREMFAYANETGATFAMVTPTARYVEQMFKQGDDAGLAAARSDARIFAEKLVAGEYGPVPAGFTIEVGSEYYATGIWKELTSDSAGRPYQKDPGLLPEKFGKVFAAVVDEMGAVFGDPELNTDGVEVKLAVQLARHQADPSQNGGDYSDNFAFIEALMDVGAIDKVDTLLFHKYTPTFDNIARGMDHDANGYNLQDAFALWEDASGGKAFEFLGGYLSPSAGAEDRLEYGAPGLTNLLQVNAQFLGAGMDVGTVYAIGHSNGGSLGWRGELLVGGKLFDLMRESIPEKFLYEGFQDNISNVADLGRSYITGDHVNTYLYGNDTEVTVFLAASDFAGDQLDYQLHFDESFIHAHVTHLWATGEQLYHPGDGEFIGSYGETLSYSVDLPENDRSPTLDVTFEHDYEVIRIVLQKASVAETTETSGDAALDPGDDGGLSAWMSGTDNNDWMTGGETIERINGRLGDDTVFGFGGDDTLKGGWGDDLVDGGAGDDRLTGDWGEDLLFGGIGNDTIFGGDGNNMLFGGDGDDRLVASGQLDVLMGGAGNDTLIAGAETTIVSFDMENALTDGDETDIVFDFVLGQDYVDIEGLSFSDDGGPLSRDSFMHENASIRGNDLEIRVPGAQTVVLKDIVSQINGTATAADFRAIFEDPQPAPPAPTEPLPVLQLPQDWIAAGDGHDVLTGGYTFDRLNGGLGNDTVSGANGDDTVKGGWGDDTVDGGAGDDRVTGDWGDDLLFGGFGDDKIFGGDGNNTLFGGDGDDRLVASGQVDFLAGGAGNDTVEAGAEMSILSFTINNGMAGITEIDVVHDFTLGQDVLEFDGVEFSEEDGGASREAFMRENAAIRGDNLEFDFGGAHKIILKNVVSQLSGDSSVADFQTVLTAGTQAQLSGQSQELSSDPNGDTSSVFGISGDTTLFPELTAGQLETAARQQMEIEAEAVTEDEPWLLLFA